VGETRTTVAVELFGNSAATPTLNGGVWTVDLGTNDVLVRVPTDLAVTASATNGSICVEGTSGAVSVTTSNGEATVHADLSDDNDVTIDGGNGVVSFTMPATQGATLDASVSIGLIQIDPDLGFAGTHDGSDANGTIGSGTATATVTLDASIADILVGAQ
jgi:hypothetical protein